MADEDAEEAPGQVTANQLILLVDDEIDILESLKTLFEVSMTGVEVRTAPTGMDALERLENEPIDLIVTDYKMPGMNGLEFLEKARQMAPNVPRILITAFPDLKIAIKAINDANIENFITKPLQPDNVLEVVRKILRDRRAKVRREQSFARSLELLRRKATTDKPKT